MTECDAGVASVTTTRFLITPALRIFLGRFATPLPASVADVLAWATTPTSLLIRETFDPADLLFRTQYYLAYDARVTKAPLPRGRRQLRAASNAEAPPPSLLVLRAAMAARIVREAPGLLANCTLRLPGDDVPFARRALLLAPAPAPDGEERGEHNASSPADALLRVSPAASALGLLGLDAAAGGAGGWAGALALALTLQVSAFTAQLADSRIGWQLESTSRPVVTAALFARLGIELDAGVNTRERLAARTPARSAGAATSPAPPPAPPPSAPARAPAIVAQLHALAGGGAALLTSLAGWASAAGLPAASLAPLSALASWASNATAAAITLPAFARRAAFVVSPHISLGLGQLAFAVPSDARALAAALAAPSLAPLLSTEVAFENALALWLDFAFVDAAPLLSLDKSGRRRRLQASAAAPTPATVMAAFRAALLGGKATAAGNDAAALATLFAALADVEFTQLSFQLFTGAAAVEALSADVRPGVGALVEAQRFTILRTSLSAGTRLTARLV